MKQPKDIAYKNYILSKTEAQLKEVKLESVKTAKRQDASSGEYEVRLNIGKHTELIDKDHVNGFIQVYVGLVKLGEKDPDLEITVEYVEKFVRRHESSNEPLEAWVDVQVIPLLISYARTFISNLTMQMGYKPLVLPTMDVLESIQHNDPESSNGDMQDGDQ